MRARQWERLAKTAGVDFEDNLRAAVRKALGPGTQVRYDDYLQGYNLIRVNFDGYLGYTSFHGFQVLRKK